MAMTKKEREQMEALLTECALYRTQDIKPDVAPPANGSGEISVGWHYNAYKIHVDQGCSSSYSHSIRSIKETDSQRPRWFFSTRLLALRAMRREIELKAARELRRVDQMIEEELAVDQ